ncbi:hypothetical protein [Kitasatospora mediocidica]|uniref:hypothetical protein n=1 Tax=Kitasatospora mediocidica TaxID=58352 RepID=UPI0005665BD4|nr:hypothetical protein [Kitasatospora mediocidica]
MPTLDDDIMTIALVTCQLNGDQPGTEELLRSMEAPQLRTIALTLVEMCVDALRVDAEFGGASLEETAVRWREHLAEMQLRVIGQQDSPGDD